MNFVYDRRYGYTLCRRRVRSTILPGARPSSGTANPTHRPNPRPLLRTNPMCRPSRQAPPGSIGVVGSIPHGFSRPLASEYDHETTLNGLLRSPQQGRIKRSNSLIRSAEGFTQHTFPCAFAAKYHRRKNGPRAERSESRHYSPDRDNGDVCFGGHSQLGEIEPRFMKTHPWFAMRAKEFVYDSEGSIHPRHNW